METVPDAQKLLGADKNSDPSSNSLASALSPQVERTWNSAVVCNDTSIVAPVKVLVFRVRALSYEFMRLTRSINPLPSGSRR
jgi:hypothetical protein